MELLRLRFTRYYELHVPLTPHDKIAVTASAEHDSYAVHARLRSDGTMKDWVHVGYVNRAHVAKIDGRELVIGSARILTQGNGTELPIEMQVYAPSKWKTDPCGACQCGDDAATLLDCVSCQATLCAYCAGVKGRVESGWLCAQCA
jgi:hypothetical protein